MRPLTKRVIVTSSLGTLFEWYDFYLYGAMASVIASQFFSSLDPNTAFIFSLLAFASGFVVRPFGSILFGRMGDTIGRKYTFMLTLIIMGLSTFAVGLIPSYKTIGVAAPILLILMRMLQGLAIGGEYGGAATYVAEHSPKSKRGAYTGWIQMTASAGLLLSLLVILAVRQTLGEEEFAKWGWRIPFISAGLLLTISMYLRMSLPESPVFSRLKAEHKLSKNPVKEAFGQWKHLKWVLLMAFGVVAGQGVLSYTGHFYSLFFLTQVLKVDPVHASICLAVALICSMPFNAIFGRLSDRVGRKPVIMCGLVLAVVSYFPVFSMLTEAANPALYRAQQSSKVQLYTYPGECSFQFNLIGSSKFTTSCDVAKKFLANNSVAYTTVPVAEGINASLKIGDMYYPSYNATTLTADQAKVKADAFKNSVTEALRSAGYPEKADMKAVNTPVVMALMFYLLFVFTMTYGPIAAMLAEMFPTRIRYTALSLPYHIGNGWFGGFLPATAFAIVAQTGDTFSGLWYPIVFAVTAFFVLFLFIKETNTNITSN